MTCKRGDWLKFNLGDRVYDIADERHVGRIDAISNSAFANITWEETGWKSKDVPLNALRKIGVDA